MRVTMDTNSNPRASTVIVIGVSSSSALRDAASGREANNRADGGRYPACCSDVHGELLQPRALYKCPHRVDRGYAHRPVPPGSRSPGENARRILRNAV